MSTIDLIISRIESLPIDGGSLTLKAGDFDGDFMAAFFSKLLVADSITFSGAARASGSETITVSGSATVLGYAGLPCSLTFDVQDNEVVGTIVGTFAKTKAITLPLITWIKLGNIVLLTSISETFQLVGLDFKMDILLDNGDTIPVEIQRQSSTEWRLDIAEGTDQGITGEDIVALLGGQALENFVPEPLSKILEGFKINDIETVLDTEQKTVSYFSLGLSVTNGWDIAPKVSLCKPSLQIGLTLINPADTDSRTAVGSLSATFDLAGVIVPITIGATIGSASSWTFGLQPGESVTLPSFSNLLELAGGSDFFATLPPGLKDIPKIDVDELMIEFDPGKKELTLLSFSLQTDSSWPVIEKYFEIQKLKIAFDITDLTDPATRAVLGDLYALFLVDQIALLCEIEKTQENPDWTITAGLAPSQTINFTHIVTGLFEGKIKPPDDVPQITFDILKITVVPDKKSFEFTAGSSSDWWIIADKLAISSFDLDFTRAQTDSGSTITGHIASTLKLKASGIELTLKASLNDTPGGGWQFSGSTGTAPIPIGTMIGDLIGFFGDFTPPPILTGLTVSNLAVTFNTTSKNFTFTCTLKDSDLPDLVVTVYIAFKHSGADSFTKKFSGTAQYTLTKFVLKFELDFVEEKGSENKTLTTLAKYNAETPPTLSDFLEFLGTELGVDADFPKELNFDADLKSLTLQLVNKDQDPLRIEAAGLFELTFGSGKPWDLYLSYTNDSYFESAGPTSRADGPTGKPAYTFGISFSGILDLTKLPLVGSIPGIADFNIDKLGFYYTDAAFTTTDNKLIFGVAELGTTTPLAPDPASAFLSQPKFSLMALFGDPKAPPAASAPNAMPLGTATSPANGPPAFASKQADPRKPITWLSIDKTIGPVELSKVGLGYEAPGKGDSGELGIVGIYFDGAFSIAGLTMVLDRLGITFPVPMPGGTIDNPLSKVGFHLGGMFLEYKAPDIEIAGGFINLPGDSVNMIGEFVVEAGPYGLQAYGGYANTLGHPSLFIFLHLNAPIGGPPFFFINGVSGGFGVNRGFKLPTYSELSTYPLLPTNPSIPTAQGLDGKSNADKLEAMTQSLLSLADYFPVEDGEYWFAVGLDVSSFEMVQVSAILSIAFGVNLQIGVIGSASMTLPVNEPEPIAYVQINFEVSYSSEDGLLAVMGAITPASFIYSGLVHLSGGFAFYTWLSGEHSGDFVLTIGGYNSHYKPPTYYPNVPRMEMRAGIGIVNLVGQAYFALLPHALMAGIDIKATADLGPISAWFYASIDFYLGWKPFHYEAYAGIEIGASFTIDLGFVKTKITIHVGVQLNIWGPSFGGTARVDLDIISFTISFGAAPAPAPVLDWTQFQAFLPSVPAPKPPVRQSMAFALAAEAPSAADGDKPLVNVLVKSGLVKDFPQGQEVDGLNWIVDANHFDIQTHSTAPCTQLVYNGSSLPADYDYLEPGDLRQQIEQHTGQEPPYFVYKTPDSETDWYKLKFGIPPMALTDIASTHTVTLRKLPIEAPTNVTDVIVTLTTGGVPPSLWGNEPVSSKKPPSSDTTVIKNALVGLQFTPMLYFPLRTTFIPYYYLVFDTNNLFLAQATAPQINPAKFANSAQIYASMQDGTAFSKTEAVRTTIADTLKTLGFDTLELVNSGALSDQDYVDDPQLTYMSSTNETVFS